MEVIMKRKVLLFLFLALPMIYATNAAAGYNYVDANTMKQWLTDQEKMTIVDIQVEPEFNAHHIKGSVGTFAYPVKSDEDNRKLDKAFAQYSQDKDNTVVIVCPRGKGGAKRAYTYMVEQGVPDDKIFILEGGMAKWPHKEWVATTSN